MTCDLGHNPRGHRSDRKMQRPLRTAKKRKDISRSTLGSCADAPSSSGAAIECLLRRARVRRANEDDDDDGGAQLLASSRMAISFSCAWSAATADGIALAMIMDRMRGAAKSNRLLILTNLVGQGALNASLQATPHDELGRSV